MGNLIFLIIIIVIVRNVMEQKKKTDGTGDQKQKAVDNLLEAFRLDKDAGRAQADHARRNTAASSNVNKAATSRSASKASQSVAPTFGTVENKTKSAKRASKASAATETWNANAGSAAEDISTTEYLRQKALEDQREHEEEARLEAMRLRRETGGRRAAQRHYDGDSIPRGMRLVRCGYCGAENLIGEREKQSDFTCYFCREIL